MLSTFHVALRIVANISESSLLIIALYVLMGESTTRKLLSLSLDLFFKIFAIPGCFPYLLFYRYISPYVLVRHCSLWLYFRQWNYLSNKYTL